MGEDDPLGGRSLLPLRHSCTKSTIIFNEGYGTGGEYIYCNVEILRYGI